MAASTLSADPAVEYGLVFTTGDVFYTGGFDEMPLPGSLNTDRIFGTFSPEEDAKWCETAIDFTAIVATIDYRRDGL